MKKDLTIALIGNPNCGKTTIFNALTGSRQCVGNWPGVTVEQKTGRYKASGLNVRVVDLPGTYSLSNFSEDASLDERIACEYILSGDADLIVNIVDGANLERNLYLTLQLIEMQVPMIVVINMMDIVKQRRIHIDTDVLSAQLGCPVVAVQASKAFSVKQIKLAVGRYQAKQQKPTSVTYAAPLESAIQEVLQVLELPRRWLAIHLLENDALALEQVSESIKTKVLLIRQQLEQAESEEADIAFANARYQWIDGCVSIAMNKQRQVKRTFTYYLDKLVLNRILGIPFFLFVMYLMFFFAINIGGAFQDFFDLGSDAIFMQGVAHVLTMWHWPDWLVALIAAGVGKGINTTITFAPVIGAMFLFLAFLQSSGYMARAAFVVDRLMRAIGLPGKSFVPMIVGFGCNVPAIMGARTLENKRDRVLTILMTPFMSCGARLAIYAVFTAAFFKEGGALIVFSLYLIGIFMAMITGLLLRKTILHGKSAPFLMELPPYHLPTLNALLMQAWQRLKIFLFKAGKLIVPICILISALNAINIHGQLVDQQHQSQSILSDVGKAVTPVFAPMGIHENNWPATLGLLTGTLAKEVVVGTLNTLYVDVGHLHQQASQFHFWTSMQAAWQTIPDNLKGLGGALKNPILAAKAATDPVAQGVYGEMYRRFDGRIGAFAYLLFILLYVPCVSTIAVMARELHRGWAVFSVVWTTAMAYGVAVVFYQGATITRHPVSSTAWIIGAALLFWLTVFSLKRYAKTDKHRRMPPTGGAACGKKTCGGCVGV